MENLKEELTFLSDRESVHLNMFVNFLNKLEGNFLALSPEAEKDLKVHVAKICELGYITRRAFNELGMMKQELQINVD